MRKVTLHRHYAMYMPSEQAAFSDHEAADIVKRKLGVYADEPTSETVTTVEPAPELAPELEGATPDAKDLVNYPDRMQRRVRTK